MQRAVCASLSPSRTPFSAGTSTMSGKQRFTGLSAIPASACVASSAVAQTTVAYWRFERIDDVLATAGATLQSPIPGGTGAGVTTLTDASGNGNSMRTFHSPNIPDSPDGTDRIETSPEFV